VCLNIHSSITDLDFKARARDLHSGTLTALCPVMLNDYSVEDLGNGLIWVRSYFSGLTGLYTRATGAWYAGDLRHVSRAVLAKAR
jgi:hypothetical protein